MFPTSFMFFPSSNSGSSDPNIGDNRGNTALHNSLFFNLQGCSFANDDLRVFYALVNNKMVNLDAQNIDGQTPLMIAVIHAELDAVKALLNAGCNATILDKKGKTALQIAEAQLSWGEYWANMMASNELTQTIAEEKTEKKIEEMTKKMVEKITEDKTKKADSLKKIVNLLKEKSATSSSAVLPAGSSAKV